MVEMVLECRDCGDEMVVTRKVQYLLFWRYHSIDGHDGLGL